MKTRCLLICTLLMVLVWAGCRPSPEVADTQTALRLRSEAFEPGGRIPAKYTCIGEGVSPPLDWEGVPEGTRSFALMLEKLEEPPVEEDADPGPVLWLVFNIAPELTALPEGLRLDERVGRDDLRPIQGGNHQRTTGYAGPCPSVGDPGRYAFRVYALSVVLPAEAGSTWHHLRQAMEGYILAEGELIGTYAY